LLNTNVGKEEQVNGWKDFVERGILEGECEKREGSVSESKEEGIDL